MVDRTKNARNLASPIHRLGNSVILSLPSTVTTSPPDSESQQASNGNPQMANWDRDLVTVMNVAWVPIVTSWRGLFHTDAPPSPTSRVVSESSMRPSDIRPSRGGAFASDLVPQCSKQQSTPSLL